MLKELAVEPRTIILYESPMRLVKTLKELAVYFGAVGIQRARHAVACALLADLAGVVASIAVCYWFFG